MGSAERNKATARRVFEELFNQRRLDVADELFAPDYRNHAGAEFGGPEGMRRLVEELTTAFPDHHTQIDDIIAEDDRVALRVTFSGTHEAAFRGMPPTGRRFSQMQMHHVRLDDRGRAVDHWAVRDDVGMMAQLGLLPTPADR
ncbi:MAG: ester cyclase [Actinobacteria bacterium]|nr:ester cyclase [Actinomycetota bacterium]